MKSYGTDYIIIDDGHKSLNVWTGALAKPTIGSYVSVTGVSSSESGAPVVKTRFATDIVTHRSGS